MTTRKDINRAVYDDLVGHLNCHYLTQLDLRVASGELAKPKIWDPVLQALVERGALHEQRFIDRIKADGRAVTIIEGVGIDAGSVAATTEAMARGEAVIVQGALEAGSWNGRTDILSRVETPSRFGSWSYEVIDTKLARETKGNTVPSDIPVLGPAFGNSGSRSGVRLRGYAGYQLFAGSLPYRRLCSLLSVRQEQS